MSRIKAQNAYWRNENVVLQIDLINMQSLIRSCILENYYRKNRHVCMFIRDGTLRKTDSIFNSIHYWQRYWVVKGIKMTGRTQRICISEPPGQPRGFRAARSQKPFKKSQELQK